MGRSSFCILFCRLDYTQNSSKQQGNLFLLNHINRMSLVSELAKKGLDAWEKLCSVTTRLVQKYGIQVCSYCPEVQVGPKGHRARTCQASKHQQRDGQHARQEATVDDIVPPFYIWHLRNPGSGEVIVGQLRWYYGRLPAVVELCSQAGVQVGKEYWGMMREDVSLPDMEEVKLVS